MEQDKVYYKSTVPYVLGVRHFIGDSMGVVLTPSSPVVEVKKDKLREFKLANKRALLDGLLLEVEEPVIEWETDNALTDEQITELTRSYLALKSRLPKLTSLPVLLRILEDAKNNERSRKTIAMIEARIEEIDDEEDKFSVHPDEMQGVE